jgi:predicted dehydrogenase
MSAAFRTAVIGVGHLGRHHARILGGLTGVQLVAVVDVDLIRAQTVAATIPGARACADLHEILDAVDAVVVAVPTVDHLAVARPFLERGIHTLIEKPLAPSLVDADALVALAARHGATLAVGHSERFNPAMTAARPLLTTPRFIEVHRLSGFPERSLDIDVVFDVMIHDLDIVLAVDGTEVTSVDAVGINVLTPKVDIANARVKFGSGCVANITASRISRDQVRKVRFFQPDSYVSIDYAAREVEAWRLTPQPEGRPKIEGGPVTVPPADALTSELSDFFSAIRLRRPPTVSGADGRRALALAQRVHDAMGTR